MESTPVATNEHQPIRYHFITARQRSCGKVMFSVVCGCQSVFPQGVQCHNYPSCIGPHCTETPQPPPPGHRSSLYRDPSLRHGTSLYRDSPPSSGPSLFTWLSSTWCWHLVGTRARTVGKRAVHILLECFVLDMLLLSIRHLGKSAENLANKGAAMSRWYDHICASVHELNLNIKKQKIDNRKVDSSFLCK